MNNIQVSGVDIAGEIPWGTYFCQFYETNKERMDVSTPYFKAGLENNELCISVTVNPLEAKEVLRWAVPDLDINLEVRDIPESKRAEDEIRQRRKTTCSERGAVTLQLRNGGLGSVDDQVEEGSERTLLQAQRAASLLHQIRGG